MVAMTDPVLNYTEPSFPSLDAFVLPALSDRELTVLVDWCERFYGEQFAPFCEWFLEVLMLERTRRGSGGHPQKIVLPIGNCPQATASGLLSSYLLCEFARTATVKHLAFKIHRHFTIAAFGELSTLTAEGESK